MIDTDIHVRRVLILATFFKFWAPFIDGWMSVHHVPVVLYVTGLPRLLPPRERKDHCNLQGEPAGW
jgi:hypothetical protein